MHRLRPPLLAHPIAEVIGQVSHVLLSLADGLGVTAEHGGDVFDASVPELGDLDGGVATSILLGERVVERAHRLFDRGSVGHGGITTGPALWSIPWLFVAPDGERKNPLLDKGGPRGRRALSPGPRRSASALRRSPADPRDPPACSGQASVRRHPALDSHPPRLP